MGGRGPGATKFAPHREPGVRPSVDSATRPGGRLARAPRIPPPVRGALTLWRAPAGHVPAASESHLAPAGNPSTPGRSSSVRGPIPRRGPQPSVQMSYEAPLFAQPGVASSQPQGTEASEGAASPYTQTWRGPLTLYARESPAVAVLIPRPLRASLPFGDVLLVHGLDLVDDDFALRVCFPTRYASATDVAVSVTSNRRRSEPPLRARPTLRRRRARVSSRGSEHVLQATVVVTGLRP